MNYAIIVAGGSGKRFSKEVKKQFFKIDTETILEKTISQFNNHKLINSIILVLPEDDLKIGKYLKYKFNKLKKVVQGGEERKHSVFNGLLTIENDTDINSKILIHDGVRPFVTENLITNIIGSLEEFNCVIPGIKIEDTLKIVDSKNYVVGTVSREIYMAVQTPQGFKKDLIDLYKKAVNLDINFTDDSQIYEYYRKKVKIIPGEKGNIKITTKEDLIKI
jgi:2-C-methyl-D-erythritol 4-phosphate cytidylyltransferase